MKICVAGGTGMIGSAVKALAEQAGHQVTVLHVPRPDKSIAHLPDEWAKELELWQPETFSGYDALMFFGGESINSRWTDKKRQRIEFSRQMPCRRMAHCAVEAQVPPKVIISASATGFYGDRGEDILDETAHLGKGFLAPTTATWEATWESASSAGIRVALLRFGVVLDAEGGALKMMIPVFRLGLGGPMGSGKQWMPWITTHDAARLAMFCTENESLTGPINAISPDSVRQEDFAKELGRVLHRPAIAPAPAAVLRLSFGQMAQETILASCKAVPKKAAEAGFHFDHDKIRPALEAAVNAD